MKTRKTSSKNDNNGDYKVDVGNGDDDDDDDDDVLLAKEEFLMERCYLSDCIIEQAKEDSNNLIPKPKESSLFYTNTKLVTRTSVHELTSFLLTNKQRTVTRKDIHDNLSNEDKENKINEEDDTETIQNNICSCGLCWLNLIFIPMTTKFQSSMAVISILQITQEPAFQMPQQYLHERGWPKQPKQIQMYGKKYKNESYK